MNSLLWSDHAEQSLANANLSPLNVGGLVTRGESISDLELHRFHYSNVDSAGRIQPIRLGISLPGVESTSFVEASSIQRANHKYHISFLYSKIGSTTVFETVFVAKSHLTQNAATVSYEIGILDYRLRRSLGNTSGQVPGLPGGTGKAIPGVTSSQFPILKPK